MNKLHSNLFHTHNNRINLNLSECELKFKASKRQPGASGRLHRKETGEWVWSSEDEAGDDASSESDTDSRPMNTLVSIGSSGSDHEESSEGDLPPVNLVLRMR